MPSGGSHGKYTLGCRRKLEQYLEIGLRPSDIAERLGVSRSWVSQLRGNYTVYGDVTPPHLSVQGRPRTIHKEAEEGVFDFMTEYPTAIQEEVVEFLRDEYDIQTSRQSVGRLMKRRNWTFKRSQRMHTERDDELRANHFASLVYFTADQVIAIDESAANKRTKDCRYGWSPRGMPCRVRLPGRRSSRWSILPVLGINGFLHYEVFHRSYNTERFNDFIERLLPMMTLFPGPRSVLLLDNCRTHHSRELQERCDLIGILLLFLPPYSPDYNPIELAFAELKS